jgi:hypothetical protein
MFALRKIRLNAGSEVPSRTPRMRGTKEAGSVDIDASSKKITGKSILFMTGEPAERHVVHTWYIVVRSLVKGPQIIYSQRQPGGKCRIACPFPQP